MRKLGVLIAFFVFVLVSSSPVFAVECDPECTGNQHCIQTGPLTGTCQSEGPGLTAPGCTVRFGGQAIAGKRLDVFIDTGDNGEVFFKSQPTFSGSCSQYVGYCPTGNVCTKTNYPFNVCADVCPTLYSTPSRAGDCTVSAVVSNGAGSTPCSKTVSVSCPTTIRLSGGFSGNLTSTCVDVFDGTAKVGTYCGTRSWISGNLPSGKNYKVVPAQIAGFSVAPTSRLTGTLCTDRTGLNFTYSANVTPTVTTTLTPTNPPPPPPPPPPPGTAFFQTIGGNVTAILNFANNNLPTGEAVSKKSTGQTDAGVVAAGSGNVLGGRLFSESGGGMGWNLIPYSSEDEFPTYSKLLGTVLRNAGVSKIADLCDSTPTGKVSSGNGRFYCFNGSGSLGGMLNAAINEPDEDAEYLVLLPYRGGVGARDLSGSYNFVNSGKPAFTRPIIVFIDGDNLGGLSIGDNLVTDKTKGKSAVVFVVKGNVAVGSSVSKQDGIYVFSDTFNDTGGSVTLAGLGSLLSSGNSLSGGFRRNNGQTGVPSELWTFQGKYLDLYKNILARPKFLWQELPPN